MPIINLNKVIELWVDHIKPLNFYERIEMQRMITASLENDFNEIRKKVK